MFTDPKYLKDKEFTFPKRAQNSIQYALLDHISITKAMFSYKQIVTE